MDIVGDPVVGHANVLEWLVVADPSPDNTDWIVSVPTMKVQMHPPFDP